MDGAWKGRLGIAPGPGGGGLDWVGRYWPGRAVGRCRKEDLLACLFVCWLAGWLDMCVLPAVGKVGW